MGEQLPLHKQFALSLRGHLCARATRAILVDSQRCQKVLAKGDIVHHYVSLCFAACGQREQIGNQLPVVSVQGELHHTAQVGIARIQGGPIADQELRIEFLHVTPPKGVNPGACQGMNISGLPPGPQAVHSEPVRGGNTFELVRGPGADFGGDVSVSVLPHLRPKSPEKRWDLVLSVQLSQQEKVVPPCFLEQKVAPIDANVIWWLARVDRMPSEIWAVCPETAVAPAVRTVRKKNRELKRCGIGLCTQPKCICS